MIQCTHRSFLCVPLEVNDFRSRGKQLSKTEAIFVTATMQFRETLKDTYSVQVSLYARR